MNEDDNKSHQLYEIWTSLEAEQKIDINNISNEISLAGKHGSHLTSHVAPRARKTSFIH